MCGALLKLKTIGFNINGTRIGFSRAFPGQAVQVLSLVDDQQDPASPKARLLKLDTQVLQNITKHVDTEGHPLAVIVIAGPERQGKSFMLTYFVRYLAALEKTVDDGAVGDWMEKSSPEITMKGRGFNFENAFERTTQGIWMWSRPFITPMPSNPDQNIGVLLIDTEGCYGSSLTNQEQAALVGLSLLTSSVFIYNETTRINDSTLATIGKFMQYGQMASQTFMGKIFHRIMFLIRDWNSPTMFEYGAAGGQGFLREFFREKPRMTQEAVEYRKEIMSNFEDCNAHLMPHPGHAVSSHNFTGSVAEMSPEFCNNLENFVTSLIADVGPKMLGSNSVTGSAFASLFQAYVDAFNATNMPSPASIIQATLYIAFNTEIKSLTGSYESSLRRRLIDSDTSSEMVASQHQLDLWGRTIADSIVGTFEKKEHRCAKEDKSFYVDRLKVEIALIHKNISEENEASRSRFIQRSTAAACAAFQSFIEKHVKRVEHYWKRPEFDAKVNPAKDECLQNCINTCSSITTELIETVLTETSDKMDQVKESLWVELAARTTSAENKASEITAEILSDYIGNIELLVGDDFQPESTLEKVHNKLADSARVSFKRRIESAGFLEDGQFITDVAESFNKFLEAEYTKLMENNEIKLDKIRGQLDAKVGKALALFQEESCRAMEDITKVDPSMLKSIYQSVFELALQALEDTSITHSQLLSEYICKVKGGLKASLDEAVATLVNSVEAKQLQCKQIAEDACQVYSQKLSSWIKATGTVSQGIFIDHSRELLQSELSNCEADLKNVWPEYSSYLEDAQELMDRICEDSAAANSSLLDIIDRFALEQTQLIQSRFEDALQNSVDQCKDLADLKNSHEEVMIKFLSQFRMKLEGCNAPSLYDSYEASCKEYMMESFNKSQCLFLQKTEALEKFRTQRIPMLAKHFKNRLVDKIKRNPFINDGEIDMTFWEKGTEVKHALFREITSQVALSSIQCAALVDEMEEHLSDTENEIKRTLSMEQEKGDARASAINQSVIDFAITKVNELLLNGISERNLEENFEILKDLTGSNFEDEWPYGPSSKKDSIKRKIHTRLDHEFHIARQKVLQQKVDNEAKLIAGYMNDVLSSFASPVVETVDAGKHISVEKLEGQLKDETKRKLEEFNAMLLLHQAEHVKYVREMGQKLEEKKREILQANENNAEQIAAGAKGLIKSNYEQPGNILNSYTGLEQLLEKTRAAVTEYLSKNCEGVCDERLNSILNESLGEAHASLMEKLEGEAHAMLATVSKDAVTLYGEEMQHSLEKVMPVHPTVLKAHHDRCTFLVLRKLGDKTFISKNVGIEVEKQLTTAYQDWVNQNILRGAEDTNPVIGIHLGLTSSCVAIHRKKKTRVIEDRPGRTLIPSLFFFHEDGSAFVGHEAEEIARIYNDETVFKAARRLTFVEDTATEEPCYIIRGKPYRLAQVLAQHLRHMKNVVEEDLKEKGNIVKAVISVPANFNERQRNATRQAAQIAGLELLQLIDKPVAAAIYYGMICKVAKNTSIVFDYGERTLHVSILGTRDEAAAIAEPELLRSRGLVRAPKSEDVASDVHLHVLATLEDAQLAGERLQSNLIKFGAGKFHEQHNIDLLDSTVPQGLLNVKRMERRLRSECKLVEDRLITSDVTTANLDAVAEDDQCKPLDLRIEITRQEYEVINNEIFQKVVGLVAQALKKAKLQKEDIDEILMVGSSSRIPRVKAMLQDFMGKQALSLNKEAIAQGAAIQACKINGRSLVKGLPRLIEVQPFSLGIRERTGRMSVIIPRNTRIPTKASEQFTTILDNQTAMDIEIFSGEDAMAENNVRLGELTFDGIPAEWKGEQLIDVTMEVDASGILNVTAVCISTGETKTLVIKDGVSR